MCTVSKQTSSNTTGSLTTRCGKRSNRKAGKLES